MTYFKISIVISKYNKQNPDSITKKDLNVSEGIFDILRNEFFLQKNNSYRKGE